MFLGTRSVGRDWGSRRRVAARKIRPKPPVFLWHTGAVRPATRGLPAAACRHGVVMQCMGCNGCQPYVGPVGTHAACRLLATTRVGACAANHHHLTCLACGSRACATLCTSNLNVCTLCCCPYCLQGMGEPLSNYDAVKAAVALMAEPREL